MPGESLDAYTRSKIRRLEEIGIGGEFYTSTDRNVLYKLLNFDNFSVLALDLTKPGQQSVQFEVAKTHVFIPANKEYLDQKE